MSPAAYIAPHVAALLIESAIFLYALRRLQVRGAKSFALAVFSQAWWTLGYVFEIQAHSLGGKIFWDDLEFLGTTSWCLSFFWFAGTYAQREFIRSKLVWALQVLINGAYLALVFTDSLHHLIRPDARLAYSKEYSALVYSFTWPTWVASLAFLGTFLTSFVVLAQAALRSGPLYRRQSLLIATGTGVPVLGMLVTLSGVLPEAFRDISPVTFAAGDLLIAWGLFRHALLDLVPIARDIVLENLEDTVVVLDEQDRVVDANPAMLRAIGRSAEQVIGKSKHEVFTQWPDLVRSFDQVYEGHVEVDAVVAGESRRLSLAVTPLRDRRGDLLGRLYVSHDITELKRVQLELQRTVGELQDMNRELDGFAYSISHDLRAPLRAMELFSKRLMEVHAGEFSAPGRELVERLHENAHRMQTMTDALLALARLGRQKLRRQTVDMRALVGEVVSELSSETAGRDLKIQVAELPNAEGDRALLRQVFMNLLTNALKFTRHNKQATIEVGFRDGQTPVTYFVRDNGVGFDMQYADKLFGVFQRLHDAHEFEGTGIGLANAKQIIQKHGGLIWGEGRVDAGATFYFTLSQPDADSSLSPAGPPDREIGAKND